jgi:hypothetical protein
MDKKRQTAQLLLFIGIAVLAVGLFLFLFPPVFAYNNAAKIGPQKGVQIANPCYSGERIQGFFTVEGGNEEVEFCAIDPQFPVPYGVVIYNAGTVKSRHDFSFSVEHEGDYKLSFYNRQNTSITIDLTGTRIATRGYDYVVIFHGAFLLSLSLVFRRRRGLKFNPKTKPTTAACDFYTHIYSPTDTYIQLPLQLQLHLNNSRTHVVYW